MITTERLVLRPHALDDFDAYAPMWLTQSMSGDIKSPLPVLNEEQVFARLLRWIGHWQSFGFGPFVAVDRETGAICGEVGFGYFRRGHGDQFDTVPEAMWKIANDFQGRGYAREAKQAALSWMDGRAEGVRLVCMIDPINTPSIALAQKLGFVEFGRNDYHGVELALFHRIRHPQ